MMVQRLLHYAWRLMGPLKKNFIFFLFIYIMGMITTLFETIGLGFKIPKFSFFSWVLDTYLFCLIIELTPGRARKFMKWGLTVFLYLLSVVDLFCVQKFNAKIGPEILNVVLDTNGRESSEFFHQYIGVDLLWSGVGLIILLLVFHILSEIHSASLYRLLKQPAKFIVFKLCLWLVVVGCIVFCAHSRVEMVRLMLASDVAEIDHHVNNRSLNTPLNNFLFAAKMRYVSTRGLTVLVQTQESVVVDSCTYVSDHIVLVIGESYIKHHSQLYGYQRNTTPLQVKRASGHSKGRLISFEDVVSPSNLTSIVFKNVLSLHSMEDSSDWNRFPLFPVLFRKAGYHVTFMTNQFLQALNTDAFNFSGGLFLNETSLSKMQFDCRNTTDHRYDEGLISDYDSLRQYNTAHNLTIFHLAGQHIDFDKRCPSEYKVFSANDYMDRSDLSQSEKQIVADYDNATYYNDYVLNEIIRQFEDDDVVVIYMPDHGEECFDELHRIGRIPGDTYTAEILRQEYRIPFWIWCSDKYIETHPQIYEQIQSSVSRPFMTDDLPHLLLYLAGIHTAYYKKDKNVISNQFNIQRVRLIEGKVDYDAVVQ